MDETTLRRARDPRFAFARWIRIAGVLFALSGITYRVFADESEEPPQLLLMRNGSIVQGKILAKGDDYLVGLPHGQMFVPGHLVRASCQDLREAYQVLLERAAAQSEAEAYITLAKWCAVQKLFPEAKSALETALNLDPGKDDARDLLVRTDELRREDEQARKDPTADRTETTRRKRGDDIESLGGLRPDLALEFTKRIQPILTNNCSLTGCHGPHSEGGFRLQRVAIGISPNRVGVERNLANVLKQIDADNPASSPLLTMSRGNHGKGNRPIFRGPTGKDQMDELKRWVQAVAQQEVVRNKRTVAKSESSSADEPDGEVVRPAGGFSAENPFAVEDAARATRKPNKGTKPNSPVRQAAAEEDLFSPEAFNRTRANRKSR